jgi:hypothetical protein
MQTMDYKLIDPPDEPVVVSLASDATILSPCGLSAKRFSGGFSNAETEESSKRNPQVNRRLVGKDPVLQQHRLFVSLQHSLATFDLERKPTNSANGMQNPDKTYTSLYQYADMSSSVQPLSASYDDLAVLYFFKEEISKEQRP